MDGMILKQKTVDFLKQYRYVALVVLVGIVLMALPDSGEEVEPAAQTTVVPVSDPQAELEEILAQIEGVGRVKVLLTIAEGEQTHYIYNEDTSSGSDSSSFRSEAVIITDAERAQQGLIQQVIPPTYQGAIVVCQGGGSPSVCLAVVEAVSDVTGLTADKITVLKMK